MRCQEEICGASHWAVRSVLAWLMLALGHFVAAEDFRVDNSVYVGEQTRPSNQSTTIFSRGAVYDFMTSPAETIVFDRSTGRFILLNMTQRTRAELKTGEVAAFADRMQLLALKSPDPVVRFLAAPKFDEQSNDELSEFSLRSPLVTYQVKYAPEIDASAVEQYHEFSDWYARLRLLLVPGSPPPFGRLVLNAALAQRKALPSEVTLTLVTRGQTTKMRSVHQVARPLTDNDTARVTKAGDAMRTFKAISFEQYRQAFAEPGK